MNLLLQLARWEGMVFLLGLAAIVFVQLLTGQMNTSYLLYGSVPGRRRNGGRYFSPERVQLLVFTLGAAFYYLSQVPNAPAGSFPEVPQNWLAVLGGSNVLYLGGKAYAQWFARKN